MEEKIRKLAKSQPDEFMKQYPVFLSEEEKLYKEYADAPRSEDLITGAAVGYLDLGDFARFTVRSPDKAIAFYQKSVEVYQPIDVNGSPLSEFRLADTYQFDLRDKINAIRHYRRMLQSLSLAAKEMKGFEPVMDWLKKWLEHEIQYLTTGQPFSGSFDKKSLGGLPFAAMLMTGDILNRGMVQLIFRTLVARYRAKGPVSDFEGELLHLTHEALEPFVVAEPLPA